MFRCKTASLCALLLAAVGVCAPLSADEPSFEQAAEKLQAATLTVRVSRADADEDSPQVTVFTGISLGKGIVVTPLFTPDDLRIRVTLPGGMQAEARTLVLDEHSGLALLKLDDEGVAGLELAADAPKVGSWVMSAAGWGVEKAVVSLGIVGGVDRSLPGANYPPLLQLDLRTAETSSGAAVVNQKGELLGVVVAAESAEGQRGWTYAVPVKHVQRLLRARPEEDKGQVLLQRRKPVVGMVLDPQEGGDVIVKQLSEDGPAAKAGIQVGDHILAADGIVIRSVYQAVRPLLFKQPGDTMTFDVAGEDGEVRTVEVVLGGGVVLPSAPSFKLANVIEPKLIVTGQTVAGGLPRRPNVAEVFALGEGVNDNAPLDPEAETIESLTAKIALLEKALDRYPRTIAAQRAKLEEAEAQIRALEAELELLKAKSR
jgi:S1-C subfamily serine protease